MKKALANKWFLKFSPLLLVITCITVQGSAEAQWYDIDTPANKAKSKTTLDQIEQHEQMRPARQRAVNLARNLAVKLNGGLAIYRPDACMFSATAEGCLLDISDKGFTFRFNGGVPGWQQMGMNPTTTTEVIISPIGTSVVQVLYNGQVR
uniref:hypothetical protein n=1 Tax=Cyanobium sp. TaxID=2164130 RepID=UPI0040474A94